VLHRPLEPAQYTSIRYTNRLLDAGAIPSIGTVGDSYDNAMAETVVGLYKTECVGHDGPFRGVHDMELATADWVAWFNEDRLHGSLGHCTPIEFEAAYHAAQNNPAA
jgi:putative transposase